ncbi:MAG TPA: 2-phospho-L-lactate guanylyltransferase [Stellaceae bacterium]|nr:2-phospho-L-lactate guanylyltransferase [Stellaceae bacterium]
MHYILIPCKPLREGKSRLASVLSAAARQKLCADLLRNSLRLALILQPAARVRVVTPDPDAHDIAKAQGVATIEDRGVGLNAAVRRGLDAILATAGADAAALILPIDLAFATADSVARAFSGTADVVLAPDAERRGTNLLFLRRRALSVFALAFGRSSFAAHRDGATRAGLSLEILDDPRLAFDLDEPDDYRCWVQKAPRQTAKPGL